jgi:LysM repeat protein
MEKDYANSNFGHTGVYRKIINHGTILGVVLVLGIGASCQVFADNSGRRIDREDQRASRSGEEVQRQPNYKVVRKDNIPEIPMAKQADRTEVYNYIRSKGVSKNHALGMMANIEAESGFKPGAKGKEADGNYSLGLFQYYKDRADKLKKYADKNDSSWEDWKTQVDYALTEGDTKKYLKQDFSTPQDASTWFTEKWERPANAKQRAKERLKWFDKYDIEGDDETPQPAKDAGPTQPVKSTPEEMDAEWASKADDMFGDIPPQAGDKYTVKAGDTLSEIAGKYGLDYRELARSNNIENPDEIDVGQEIELPVGGSESPVEPTRLSEKFKQMAKQPVEPEVELPAPKYDPYLKGFNKQASRQSGMARRI